MDRERAPWGKIAVGLIGTMLVLPLICVNVTEAGLLSEEAAELTHGALSAYITLWAVDALHWPSWLP